MASICFGTRENERKACKMHASTPASVGRSNTLTTHCTCTHLTNMAQVAARHHVCCDLMGCINFTACYSATFCFANGACSLYISKCTCHIISFRIMRTRTDRAVDLLYHNGDSGTLHKMNFLCTDGNFKIYTDKCGIFNVLGLACNELCTKCVTAYNRPSYFRTS